jgi:hypothetical protein
VIILGLSERAAGVLENIWGYRVVHTALDKIDVGVTGNVDALNSPV